MWKRKKSNHFKTENTLKACGKNRFSKPIHTNRNIYEHKCINIISLIVELKFFFLIYKIIRGMPIETRMRDRYAFRSALGWKIMLYTLSRIDCVECEIYRKLYSRAISWIMYGIFFSLSFRSSSSYTEQQSRIQLRDFAICSMYTMHTFQAHNRRE